MLVKCFHLNETTAKFSLFLQPCGGWLPNCSCAGWLLHNTDSISWRRPQLPGDCPAGGPAHPSALNFLLSTIAERIKCGQKKNINVWVPIAWPLVTHWVEPGQNKTRFLPRWSKMGNKEKKTRKQQSLCDLKESFQLGTEGRGTQFCSGIRERKKGGFENLALCWRRSLFGIFSRLKTKLKLLSKSY